MNDDGWLEGVPQWWWKFVLPSQEEFWRLIALGGPDTEPVADRWKQAAVSLLEALALLRGIDKGADAQGKTRLHQETIQRIQNALKAVEATRV
jgi:hypothetical protein